MLKGVAPSGGGRRIPEHITFVLFPRGSTAPARLELSLDDEIPAEIWVQRLLLPIPSPLVRLRPGITG